MSEVSGLIFGQGRVDVGLTRQIHSFGKKRRAFAARPFDAGNLRRYAASGIQQCYEMSA